MQERVMPIFENFTIQDKKIYSFCVNFDDARRKSYIKTLERTGTETDIKTSINWNGKYGLAALLIADNFLKNTEQDDYFGQRDVVFMMDYFIMDLPIIDHAKYGANEGETFRQYLIRNQQNFSNRLNVYEITSDRDDFCGVVNILGQNRRYIKGNLATLLRYVPLNWPFIEECHIRDVHSTLPNLKIGYNFDKQWLQEWSKTDKKYFMYTGVWYNAPHSRGLRTPFAATCCFRKLSGDYSCFGRSKDTFNNLFSVYTNVKGDYIGSDQYGVDEKLLLRILRQMDNLKNYQDYRFTQNCYFVGLSWIVYQALGTQTPLSNTMYNLRGSDEGYQKLYDNKESKQLTKILEPYNYKNRQDEVIKVPYSYNIKNPDQFIIYINDTPFISPNTQFVDSRCSMKYLIKTLSEEIGRPATIREYFDYIYKVQNYVGGNNIEGRFTKKSLDMLYPREHIWEYIFAPPGEFIEDQDIKEYIRAFSQGYNIDMSYDNICDVNIKYRKEQTFDFSHHLEGGIKNTWYILE